MGVGLTVLTVIFFELFWAFLFFLSLDCYGKNSWQTNIVGALTVFTPLIGFVYWLIWGIK